MHSFTCIVLLLGAITFHTAATPMPQVDGHIGICPDKKPCSALEICSDGAYCPTGLPLDNPFEQEEDDNKPICRDEKGASVPGSKQDRCRELGAVCAGGLTFLAKVDSGNPENCGNLCDCDKSNCPAVLPDCGADTCSGIPDVELGFCSPGLGKGLGGCPCNNRVSGEGEPGA